MTIPTHKDWRLFKKTYGVADKAAKNVSVGAELDKYKKAGAGPKAQVAALALLETRLKLYGTTIDKKKVKKYQQFVPAYKDKYLDPVGEQHQFHKGLLDEGARYKAALTKFFKAVDGLGSKQSPMGAKRPGGAQARAEYQAFTTGPVATLKAASKDGKIGPLEAGVGPDLDKMINAFRQLPANPSLLEINAYLDVVRQAAAEIKEWTDGLNYVNPQG
jgi:hypothetical protein